MRSFPRQPLSGTSDREVPQHFQEHLQDVLLRASDPADSVQAEEPEEPASEDHDQVRARMAAVDVVRVQLRGTIAESLVQRHGQRHRQLHQGHGLVRSVRLRHPS